jgi:hypothetical protein
VYLLQAGDGGRDPLVPGLELKAEVERIVPRLMQVATVEPQRFLLGRLPHVALLPLPRPRVLGRVRAEAPHLADLVGHLLADQVGRPAVHRPVSGRVDDQVGRQLCAVLEDDGVLCQVQLFSAEHFEQAQHPWYCTAAPIHHPVSGELLGVVDVSGPALTLHPVIGALVETAVKLAESQLWRHHEQRLERLRQSARGVLATVHGPLLLVDDHGWVAHQSGIAVRDRIEVPRADRLIAVPGLGLCTPERIGEGWLVRPHEAGDDIVAELDLTGTPVLRLRSNAEPWRTPLTRRHADVLVLLQRAGRSGMTAARLSTALFGDEEHCVTVRAEISRLRRVIGGLVTTNPYRLADGVTLSVVRPDGASPRWRGGQGEIPAGSQVPPLPGQPVASSRVRM